ncbi:MAG: esterase-like activity of phytase family protein [Chloroflexota bacterium]
MSLSIWTSLLIVSLCMTGCSFWGGGNEDTFTREPITIPPLTTQAITSVDLLGMASFDTDYTFADTPVGGLSALTYDAANDVYYTLSDDRSQRAAARFYQLTIDIGDGMFSDGDVVFTGVITLLDEEGEAYGRNSVDPEGIALSTNNTVFVSSEGDADARTPIPPFVHEYALDGRFLRALPLPDKYLPNRENTVGVRYNRAFENLTRSPNGQTLTVAVENALAQDGPVPSVEQQSTVRVLHYDLATGEPAHEVVYVVDTVPAALGELDSSPTKGLVELAAVNEDGVMLALERTFIDGQGNTVVLHETHTTGAADVLAVDALGETIDTPMAATQLVDVGSMMQDSLGVVVDNVEGMALGPVLDDGRQVLILVSDNNFNDSQVTQFIALGLTIEQ